MDSFPDFNSIDALIYQKFFPFVKAIHKEEFINDLCQWWMRRVDHFLKDTSIPIIVSEFETKFHELNQKYSRYSLHIVNGVDVNTSLNEQTFVKQIELIEIRGKTLEYAKDDFMKATNSRKKWIDDCLISSLEDLDEKLKREWSTAFERIQSTMNDDSSNNKIKAGKEVYYWMENDSISIRYLYHDPDFGDPVIIRGSYHYLSNLLSVGWHPDYLSLLREEQNG